MKLIQMPDGSWVKPSEVSCIKAAPAEPPFSSGGSICPARVWVFFRGDGGSSQMVYITLGTTPESFDDAKAMRDNIADDVNSALASEELGRRLR